LNTSQAHNMKPSRIVSPIDRYYMAASANFQQPIASLRDWVVERV